LGSATPNCTFTFIPRRWEFAALPCKMASMYQAEEDGEFAALPCKMASMYQAEEDEEEWHLSNDTGWHELPSFRVSVIYKYPKMSATSTS
jgi:hypothetical protein